MSTLDNLIAARLLILDFGKWTQGTLRDDDTGCHCALGAVAEVSIPGWDGTSAGVYSEVNSPSLITKEAEALAAVVPQTVPGRDAYRTVFIFNDSDPLHQHDRHAKVIKMFDDAIEAERKARKAQTIRNLTAARALIEKGWYQGNWASTQEGSHNGFGVGLRDDRATCYCALGAVGQVCTQYGVSDLLNWSNKPEVRALRDALPEGTIVGVDGYNDLETTTKADILALFDRAIASLSEQPSAPVTAKAYKPAHGGYPGEVK